MPTALDPQRQVDEITRDLRAHLHRQLSAPTPEGTAALKAAWEEHVRSFTGWRLSIRVGPSRASLRARRRKAARKRWLSGRGGKRWRGGKR